MADQTSPERCWIVRRARQNAEYADEQHYTEQRARDEARDLLADGEPATVEQLAEPCITLACQGCGYQVDEDDEGIIHFESHQQAREYVLGIGDGAAFDGDALTRCSSDCPGDAEEATSRG